MVFGTAIAIMVGPCPAFPTAPEILFVSPAKAMLVLECCWIGVVVVEILLRFE